MSTSVKKVVVGLSGGVDSSVSALLLKEQGFQVTGVFLKAWQPEGFPCTWREDRLSAMRAAASLKIPFETWDVSSEYKALVVDEMIQGYTLGETPNPDILCNEKIKFGLFAEKAFERGAEYVATGHYARTELQPDGTVRLLSGVDEDKDQSYFLSHVSGEVLRRTLFPIGALQKSEVRTIAKKAHLPTAERPDSQGLCFMGELDVKAFLKGFVPHRQGEVLSESGAVIGSHEGVEIYTLGERHGFVITDDALRRTPLYVVGKDVKANTLTVSPRSESRTSRVLKLRDVHEINAGSLMDGQTYGVRYRYRQALIEGVLTRSGENVSIELAEPVLYASPGQTVAFYENGACLGGAIIAAA
jgi:tRNA-specific 2-thiouridylase